MSVLNNKFAHIAHPEDLRQSEVETGLLHKSRIRRTERFLKGPIPMRDIGAAARLPGQALALLLAIHHRIALTGKPAVTLPARLLADLGISRTTKSRGLKALESAELVTVVRSKGKAAVIQLIN